MKKNLKSVIVLFFTMLLLTSCSAGISSDEAKDITNDLFDAIKKGSFTASHARYGEEAPMIYIIGI